MLRGVLWRLCTRLSVGSLTAKLDGSPLADHRAVRVGGHAGVLSFVLVPDGVADDEVAAHQAVMVRLFVQVHFDVVFQPTAGEKTRVKGGKFTLCNASWRQHVSPDCQCKRGSLTTSVQVVLSKADSQTDGRI